MCTLDPPTPNLELAWLEIERAAVAAQMDERTPHESLEAMCNAVRQHLGVPSELSTDGAPPEIHTHRAVVERGRETVTVSWMGNALDDATNRRLERLFALVGERTGDHAGHADHATPSLDVHRLRNHVAGIQANVELAKLLVDTAPPASHRDEIVKALEHALTKCRAMVNDMDARKKSD